MVVKLVKSHRSVIDGIGMGFYELSYRGDKIIDVDEFSCKLSGYSRSELLLMDPFHLLDGESIRKFAENIVLKESGEDPKNFMLRARKRDGSYADILINRIEFVGPIVSPDSVKVWYQIGS